MHFKVGTDFSLVGADLSSVGADFSLVSTDFGKSKIQDVVDLLYIYYNYSNIIYT